MPTWGTILQAMWMLSNEITDEKLAEELDISVPTLRRWRMGAQADSPGRPRGLTGEGLKQALRHCKDTYFNKDEEKFIIRLLAGFEAQNVETRQYWAVYDGHGLDRTLDEILYSVSEKRLLRPDANRESRTVKPFNLTIGEKNRDTGPVGIGLEGIQTPRRRLNADGKRLILEDVAITITVPRTPFPVEYYLRHVQNGQNEFLPENDRIPLNLDYPFHRVSEDIYTAVVKDVTLRQGFQFKCFGVCGEVHTDQLVCALREHLRYQDSPFRSGVTSDALCYADPAGRQFPLVEASMLRRGVVWFLLPQYGVYITRDPFINNYYFV